MLNNALFRDNDDIAFSGNGNIKQTEAEKELSDLKGELSAMKMQRDILKKTTVQPSYDGLVLFKMSLFQTWYVLNDYEVEDSVNDSISFSRFVGISFDDTVPDHSFLSRFRREMTQKGADPKGAGLKIRKKLDLATKSLSLMMTKV